MHMHFVHCEISDVEHLVINEKGALSSRTDHAITVTHMHPLKLCVVGVHFKYVNNHYAKFEYKQSGA